MLLVSVMLVSWHAEKQGQTTVEKLHSGTPNMDTIGAEERVLIRECPHFNVKLMVWGLETCP